MRTVCSHGFERLAAVRRRSRTLAACAVPLVVAALIGAPQALADGAGLPLSPVSDVVPVTATVQVVAATVASTLTTAVATATALPAQALLPVVQPIRSTLAPVLADVQAATPSRGAVAVGTAAAPVILPFQSPPSQARTTEPRRPRPPRGHATPRHADPLVVPAVVAPQSGHPLAGRERLVPISPTPDRSAYSGGADGAATGSASGFVLLLLAIVAAVVAVVRPGRGGRVRPLVRALQPAALALELERPG